MDVRFLVIGLILLSGCVSNKPVALPDGRQGIAVDCSGVGYNWSYCMNKAADACHGPYDVVMQDGNSPGTVQVGTMAVAAQNRTMVVACHR
jgi:hypothetical protein